MREQQLATESPSPKPSEPAVQQPVEASLPRLEQRLSQLIRQCGVETPVVPDVIPVQARAIEDQPPVPPAPRAPGRAPLRVPERVAEPVPGKTEQSGSPPPLPTAVKAARVMVVDDEHHHVLRARQYLRQAGFDNFITTTRPQEALALMRSGEPDVVLLDMDMGVPRVNGVDMLRAMRLDPILRRMPVIACCEPNQHQVQYAVDLGAHDVLEKPVDPRELVLRVRNAALLKQEVDRTIREQSRLEGLVRRRTEDLLRSRQQLILSLARAAEYRDTETSNHVMRVGRYAGLIADGLGFPRQRVELIEQAAQLHDVGKIGIPDSILFKPDQLDPQEYELMKKHALLGKDIIQPLSAHDFEVFRRHASLGEQMLRIPDSPMMTVAAVIAETHHERWDGTGYPLGLKGQDIPIEGRITAVADVFDAVSSKRPYKPAFPRERCFEILEEGSGTQFDPACVEAFFRNSNRIVEVQLALADNL